MRLHFEHVSAESGAAPYAGSSEPWIIEPTSATSASEIEAAIGELAPGRDLLDSQLEGFADALAGRGELPVTIQSARPTIELLTAIYASAASGKPVDLPHSPWVTPAYESWAHPDWISGRPGGFLKTP